MKPREVTPRRLANTRLMGPPFLTPEDAVRWHGAMQGQDYAPTKWSIALRTANVTDADVDGALTEGSILRTHVLRPTWHLVGREDIRWMLRLTGPRVQQRNGPRYRELGLDAGTLSRCERVISAALDGGRHLSRPELAAALDGAGIDRAGQRLPSILMHCELEAVICSGAVAGGKQTYARFDQRVRDGGRLDRDQALVELLLRYLGSHGPATIRDFAWWSSLTVAEIRRAADLLGEQVRAETVQGTTFWSIGGEDRGRGTARGVHLLPAYDELLVGYAESRLFGDPRAETTRAAWRERGLPMGVVLLNGRVAGHWRRTSERRSVRVEARLHEEQGRAGVRALEAAAEDLGRFVGQPVVLDVKRL